MAFTMSAATYVNVPGVFNDWKDNGVEPNASGISTHANLPIGNTGFKVKVWDGAKDNWYSTGGAVNTGEWVKISGNADANMTVEGATATSAYKVEFNVNTNSIRLTDLSGSETPVDPVEPGTVKYELNANMFNGTNWEQKELVAVEGQEDVYSVKATVAAMPAEGGYNFSIKKTEGETVTWITSAAENTTVQIGADKKNAAKVGGQDWWMTEAGEFTFTFNAKAMELVVVKEGGETPEPQPATYTLWYGKDASDTEAGIAWKSAELEGEALSAKITVESGVNFNIVGSDNKVYMAAKDADSTVKNGEAMQAILQAGDNAQNFWIAEAGTYTVSFDAKDLKVTVTWEAQETPDPQPGTVKYELNSNMFNGTNWEQKELVAVEGQEDVYSVKATVAAMPAEGGYNFSIKKTEGETVTWITSAAENTTVQIGADKKNAAKVGGQDWWMTEAGEFTFTFNAKAMELVVVKEGGETPEPQPATYTLWYGKDASDTEAGIAWKSAELEGEALSAKITVESGVNFNIVGSDNKVYMAAKDADSTVKNGEAMQAILQAGDNAQNFWIAEAGTYTVSFDAKDLKVTVTWEAQETPEIEMPAELYVIGDLDGESWNPMNGVKMEKVDNTFVATVRLTAVATENVRGFREAGKAYYSFATKLATVSGDDGWNQVNEGDRYGAEAKDTPMTLDNPLKLVKYAAGVNASAAASWGVNPGWYTITADFENMTVKVNVPSGIEVLNAMDAAEEAIYFNLQGVRVVNPENGVYIRVANGKSQKVVR